MPTAHTNNITSSLVHSFVIDPSDSTFISKEGFTSKELEEIKGESMISIPELDGYLAESA